VEEAKREYNQRRNTLKRDWSESLGGGGTVGDEMYPAKYPFGSSGSCVNDFAVFNTSLAGSGTQASIIAYRDLYSTCGSPVPATAWAFNTGGTIVTSVVLSLDGTQVAFVQTVGTTANLVLLKWANSSGTVAAPTTPQSVPATGYRLCLAPCMTSLAFSGTPTPNDTNSAPYYSYSRDIIYAGANNGTLHKFANIFLSGTPAEVTSGWPITVHTATVLSSPVADDNTDNVFVGDASGLTSYVRDLGSSTGTCNSGVTLPCLGQVIASLGGSIVDGPLLDGSTQRVFWFDGTSSNNGEVVQMDETLSNPRVLPVGGNAAGSNMHVGTFDNTYLSSASNNVQGFLYLCGKRDNRADWPRLFRVGFSAAGVMNTTPDGGTAGIFDLVFASGEECSPVTESYNSGTDRIFVSVEDNNSAPQCGAAGCLMSFIVTNWSASTAFPLGFQIIDTNRNIQQVTTAGSSGATQPTWNATVGGITSDGATLKWTNEGIDPNSGANESGGTSGVIIDNTAIVAPSGSADVYFSTLTGSNAVQATQAGLN
jgi:hypothetical protein